MFAFISSEPARLDTGSEYLKLSLSTMLTVNKSIEDKFEVSRIAGSCVQKSRHGLIPAHSLTLVPRKYVPLHHILAEKFAGKLVNVFFEDNPQHDSDDRPYYDAGPNSRFLENGATLKIKEVHAEYTNVNLLDSNGSNVGFGKIRSIYLKWAKIQDG